MKKILVVDDEADVQSLFTQHFRKEIRNGEIEIFFSLSAQDAIDKINGPLQDVQFVFSDINMPGMSGFDLLKELHLGPGLKKYKVFMISAYSDSLSIQMSKELGVEDFFTKPLDFSSVKNVIKSEQE
ncbi:MAG: response regulator [Saprospiraceae bacterium]|nr:response regulator [Saprospiraceae bacterium]